MIPRFAFAILCVFLVSPLGAQEPPERKKLVFPPGELQPQATPDDKPEPKVQDPAKIIDLFFLALQADKVDNAYDSLVKDTIIAERSEDVTALKARTTEALDNYGPIRGYEVIEDHAVGKSLFRRTSISLNSDLPLRWRFYFYRTGGEWKLVDLRVDDGLVELFDDAAKKRP
ncbi:MAG: hypothetical protein WEB60_04245 [Terrimicrobiaceae bacterium]